MSKAHKMGNGFRNPLVSCVVLTVVGLLLCLAVVVAVPLGLFPSHTVIITAKAGQTSESQFPEMYVRVNARVGDREIPIRGLNFEDVLVYDLICQNGAMAVEISADQKRESEVNRFGVSLMNRCSEDVTVTIQWFDNNIINYLIQ
jgi:hypothetical protein